MTVAQLIELLKEMPQHVEVKNFDWEYEEFLSFSPPRIVSKDNGHDLSSYLRGEDEKGIVVI